jgi:FlgN protein
LWYEEDRMGLREVSAILWRERHLLELLLFKLDEEQLVLAAGRSRWLARATREVEMVLEEIRQTELERAVEVSRVAVDLGLPAGASLRQLSEAAPPPWQGMLIEHRQAFLSLTDEITVLVQTNRELLLRGQKAVREVLASIGDGKVEVGAGYGGRSAAAEAGRPFLIDEAL